METKPVRCLLLACGNRLRGDDGVGPCLADWAHQRFPSSDVRVISSLQWTPELAEDLARAQSVIFLDGSSASEAGVVHILPVAPAQHFPALSPHHLAPEELLALADSLYNSRPRNALLLTVGTGATEVGESFSPQVREALPEAQAVLEEAVLRLLKSA